MSKDEKEQITLTPYEQYCTDFLAKISLICLFIFITLLLVMLLLFSYNTVSTTTLMSLSYYEFISMIFIILSILSSIFLIIPVIFQMIIFMIEDTPDKKIPIKRGINRIILGLSLFTLIFLCFILPGILSFNSPISIILFLLSLIIDTLSIKLRLKYNLSFKIIISLIILSTILLFSSFIFIPFSLQSLFIIPLSKIGILFMIHFIHQFKHNSYLVSSDKNEEDTSQGKKRNVLILSFVLLISLHCIILYSMFNTAINQYILNNGESLVNQLYFFGHKMLTENPLKLIKLIPV
ncbi:putative transporter [Pseudoloma neurophilia]|uniref:Putative transporter n=1 Tax=Pseudoloma neurophilia TaxID=146866 RepID=A0A0R0M789_9MICR|nr:putative transporter [Pseudoloma neurophilia]